MRLWLTKRPNCTHVLTYLKPVTKRVYGTRVVDVYLEPGEPIGVMNLCEPGVQQLLGRTLESLETIYVDLTMTEIPRG